MRLSGHVDRLRLLHIPSEGKTESTLSAAHHAVRDPLSGTLASVDEIQKRYPDYLIV